MGKKQCTPFSPLTQVRVSEVFEEYMTREKCLFKEIPIILGYSDAQVRNVKNGSATLQFEMATRICQLMDPSIRPLWLMGYDDWKTEEDVVNDYLEEHGLVAVPKQWQGK